MKLVDVHCHLDMDTFDDDRDEVISNAKDNNVTRVITNGTNRASNEAAVELARKYDIVEAALGVYPTDCLTISNEAFDDTCQRIRDYKPIAVGEIGLDYTESGDYDRMRDCFKKQLEIANELDIPVIVHSRDAEQDCIDILEDTGHEKVIMHCFGGRKHQVKQVINNDWYFSIPPIVSYLEHFQMIVELANKDRLLTETDAPFLSPHSNIDRSEPAFVQESVQAIASIHDTEVTTTAREIHTNYRRLFH